MSFLDKMLYLFYITKLGAISRTDIIKLPFIVVKKKVSKNTYNAVGLVQSTREHLNKTTNYLYDKMGRLTKTTYPDGTVSMVDYTWSSTPVNSVYIRTESGTGKPRIKTCYDAINCELRSFILKFNDQEMHTDKKYDSTGRLYQVSLPFTGTTI